MSPAGGGGGPLDFTPVDDEELSEVPDDVFAVGRSRRRCLTHARHTRWLDRARSQASKSVTANAPHVASTRGVRAATGGSGGWQGVAQQTLRAVNSGWALAPLTSTCVSCSARANTVMPRAYCY